MSIAVEIKSHFVPYKWTEQDHEDFKKAIQKVKQMRDENLVDEGVMGAEKETDV